MCGATDAIEPGLTSQHLDDNQVIAARLREDGLDIRNFERRESARLRSKRMRRGQGAARGKHAKSVASVHSVRVYLVSSQKWCPFPSVFCFGQVTVLPNWR